MDSFESADAYGCLFADVECMLDAASFVCGEGSTREQACVASTSSVGMSKRKSRGWFRITEDSDEDNTLSDSEVETIRAKRFCPTTPTVLPGSHTFYLTDRARSILIPQYAPPPSWAKGHPRAREGANALLDPRWLARAAYLDDSREARMKRCTDFGQRLAQCPVCFLWFYWNSKGVWVHVNMHKIVAFIMEVWMCRKEGADAPLVTCHHAFHGNFDKICTFTSEHETAFCGCETDCQLCAKAPPTHKCMEELHVEEFRPSWKVPTEDLDFKGWRNPALWAPDSDRGEESEDLGKESEEESDSE